MSQLEEAYAEEKGDRQDVPPWEDYTLWYLALQVEGNRMLTILGSCLDEDLSDVVAIADGGPCRFVAQYDVESEEVSLFRFQAYA